MLDEEGVDALISGLRDRLVGNEPAESLPEYVPKGAAIVEAAQVLRPPAPSPPPPPPPPSPPPITAAAATAATAAPYHRHLHCHRHSRRRHHHRHRR